MSLLVAGGLLFAARTTWKGNEQETTGKSASSSIGLREQKDSDGDGLLDWEELLQGTDPDNPDSDGDGIPDSRKETAEEGLGTRLAADPSLVDSIAPTRVLLENFSGYINSYVIPGEEYDITFDDKLNSAFVAGSQKELEKLNALLDPYSVDNVLLTEDKSTHDYINEIAVITEKNFPGSPADEGYRNELTVIYELALQVAKDQEAGEVTIEKIQNKLDELATYEYRYTNATRDLVSTGVPPSALPIHVSLLNSLSNTAVALRQIRAYSRDPILGLNGMGSYDKEVQKISNIFSSMKDLLAQEGVVFKKNEPGYRFWQSYVKKAS